MWQTIKGRASKMKCVICRQGETNDVFTTVTIGRVVIKNAPAKICSFCGEVYVDETVAARLLEDAENLYKAKIIEDDYSEDLRENIRPNRQTILLTHIRQRRSLTPDMDIPDSLTLLREDRDR